MIYVVPIRMHSVADTHISGVGVLLILIRPTTRLKQSPTIYQAKTNKVSYYLYNNPYYGHHVHPN
jgi:hypothetical protein